MIISNNIEVIVMAKKEKAKLVVEEAPVNEQEEQQKLEASLDVINLDQNETLNSFSEKIEKGRDDFYSTFSKQRKLSNFLIPIVGLVMAASFVLFLAVNGAWGKIVGGVIIGVTLVGMIIFYIITKNKLPTKSQEYLRNFAITSNNFLVSKQEVVNPRLLFKKRYAISDFLPDRVYKDVVDIASRNIVEFDFKGHAVQIGEAALYKKGEKRNQKQLLFVGRYLSFSNDYHFEDRYIINISKKDKVDLPTDFEDLKILKEQNNFAVYGKENANYVKDLGKDVINNLMSIDCKDSLLNVNIVVWAGHTAAYLSYDDSIVAIPLDKQLNAAAYQQLKKNVYDILDILLEK